MEQKYDKRAEKEYRKLSRQVDEAYNRLFNSGSRRRDQTPNNFNNRLKRMQRFLSLLDEDYSKNKYMNIDPLKQKDKNDKRRP